MIGYDIDAGRSALLQRMRGVVATDAQDVVRRSRCVLLALVQPAVTVQVIEAVASDLQQGDIVKWFGNVVVGTHGHPFPEIFFFCFGCKKNKGNIGRFGLSA